MDRLRQLSDEIDQRYDAMLVDGISAHQAVLIERRRDAEHAALQRAFLEAVRNA